MGKVSKIAIIYSVNLCNRRRVIIPESDDSELDSHINCIQEGEGVAIFPYEVLKDDRGVYFPGKNLDAALEDYLGIPAKSDRCVVVKDGKVVEVVSADASIDAHPKGELIHDDVADIGLIITKGMYGEPILVSGGEGA